MKILNRVEAEREGRRRFGNDESRFHSFMESWRGLMEKGKFGRAKYYEYFGRGRRSINPFSHRHIRIVKRTNAFGHKRAPLIMSDDACHKKAHDDV